MEKIQCVSVSLKVFGRATDVKLGYALEFFYMMSKVFDNLKIENNNYDEVGEYLKNLKNLYPARGYQKVLKSMSEILTSNTEMVFGFDMKDSFNDIEQIKLLEEYGEKTVPIKMLHYLNTAIWPLMVDGLVIHIKGGYKKPNVKIRLKRIHYKDIYSHIEEAEQVEKMIDDINNWLLFNNMYMIHDYLIEENFDVVAEFKLI